MKSDQKEIQIKYSELGLNPIPLKGKIPQLKGWEEPRTEDQLNDYVYEDIGICTGVVSGGLEAIDIDLKYHGRPKDFLRKWQKKVGKDLLDKLVVQSTENGGFHFIYRCPVIEGNKILAKNESGDVLIETRGDGGFIKCYPSNGYELEQGDFEDIPIITALERNRLFSASFLMDEEVFKKNKTRNTSEKFSKFPKFDEDIDKGLELLEKHGWTIVKESEDWFELRRPGKDEGISAGYHKEGKFLFVHTTSTTFNQRVPYNNYAIYAELEHDGDYSEAYRSLNSKGYGMTKTNGSRSTRNEAERKNIDEVIQNLSFLSSEEDEEDFLLKSLENKIELGLSTGWPSLDEYMRLKRNSFNMGLGFDGVGKSLLMLSLASASNVLHDWKWGMVMPENKTAMSRRRLIECNTGVQISELQKDRKLFLEMRKRSMDNFKIVSNKHHYSLRDVIEMGKKMYEHYGIQALLVDPWNFFKVSGGQSTYDWNNSILSEFRIFAEEYCSVYIMAHPSSESPRKNKDKDGYLMAPSSYDIQGGADFPYRVDDFFVFHRVLNHPSRDIKRTMQLIMHKVKEEETGGKRHVLGEYTALKWGTVDGFTGYWDDTETNPMYEKFKQEFGKGGERPDLIEKHKPKKVTKELF